MVPGGLEVMSYTTRLTRGTRLQMRADTSRSSAFVNSYLQGGAYTTQSKRFQTEVSVPSSSTACMAVSSTDLRSC